MSAPLLSLCVGVVIERRKATSAWVDFVWQPVAVLPGVPDTKPWSLIEGDEDAARFYAGTATVALYRADVPRYLENLNSGAPALWVVLRPTGAEPPYDLVAVTANPSEGEAFTEAGSDIVDTVPMTKNILAEIAEFVAANPATEEVFYKRKQQRADPDALARRDPRRPDAKTDAKP